MDKKTVIKLTPAVKKAAKPLVAKLLELSKLLEKTTKECEKAHEALWNKLDEDPAVNIEKNLYSYNHTEHILTFQGDQEDAEEENPFANMMKELGMGPKEMH